MEKELDVVEVICGIIGFPLLVVAVLAMFYFCPYQRSAACEAHAVEMAEDAMTEVHYAD